MDERLRWNEFKKIARQKDPLGSNTDYMYYKRLRSAYNTLISNQPTMDMYVPSKHSDKQPLNDLDNPS